MFPDWFHLLAVAAISLGVITALIILFDVVKHPQHMAIMNVVWPVTALFGTIPLLLVYWRYRRHSHHHMMAKTGAGGEDMRDMGETPFYIMVGKGALHCGSGCMIGDVIAEWLAFAVPGVAIALGWQTLFSEKMFAVWILDFIFAFGFGVIFQYLAIVPMRNLTPAEGIIAALKADTLSLLSWQVGMYGAMAALQLWIFPAAFGAEASVNSFEFWFAMQIAMICGFITSYPVNWYLVAAGIKEKM
ncbi:DUF4396 domain-containing protein [Agrobacterium sp. ES01]|uniref:DUF4396 domain-containing protein n=1 Tax=Agrobacterium sp. ES01 TaxID=3420714 RepID=UPI003D111CC4